MNYDTWRTTSIRNIYASAIRSLVARYHRGEPTVILLPGGMGSQLDRSLEAHTPQALPPEIYDPVWADVGLLFNQDALTLEIDAQGRDRDRHVILPDGPLDFLIKAYDGTEEYFTDLGWNFATFGYDWRRSIAEAAGFLEEFLLLYKRAVQRKHNEDPLPRTTLFAHSQGGLVAKMFLHRVIDVRSWVDKVITVGTPFYGTWSHQQRYFVGEDILNLLHGAPEVARIVGTLPGPYVLMYLSHDVFERDGQRLGLSSYPISDAESGDPADPYAPSSRPRYPAWVSSRHLAEAKALLETIATPLPTAVQACFYNLRSRLDQATPTALSWRRIEAGFDPITNGNPIGAASTQGGGDGTVPGWAAWHAHTPDSHRVELEVAHSHADLAEHGEVLAIVERLIEESRVATSAERPREDTLYGTAPAAATRAEVEAFVRDVRASEATRDDPRASDPAIWRGLYREFKR